jgi:hypothetical protein
MAGAIRVLGFDVLLEEILQQLFIRVVVLFVERRKSRPAIVARAGGRGLAVPTRR